MVSKGGETQKQKPAFWAGSLNSGARTRNRTKDTGIFNPCDKMLNSIEE